jgi:hypothetical protein
MSETGTPQTPQTPDTEPDAEPLGDEGAGPEPDADDG